MVLLYLKHEDYEFENIARIVLESLKSSDITVVSTRFWNNTYHIGYMDNPFHNIVHDTYHETRSK